jgi:hypothetical protein
MLVSSCAPSLSSSPPSRHEPLSSSKLHRASLIRIPAPAVSWLTMLQCSYIARSCASPARISVARSSPETSRCRPSHAASRPESIPASPSRCGLCFGVRGKEARGTSLRETHFDSGLSHWNARAFYHHGHKVHDLRVRPSMFAGRPQVSILSAPILQQP